MLIFGRNKKMLEENTKDLIVDEYRRILITDWYFTDILKFYDNKTRGV